MSVMDTGLRDPSKPFDLGMLETLDARLTQAHTANPVTRLPSEPPVHRVRAVLAASTRPEDARRPDSDWRPCAGHMPPSPSLQSARSGAEALAPGPGTRKGSRQGPVFPECWTSVRLQGTRRSRAALDSRSPRRAVAQV